MTRQLRTKKAKTGLILANGGVLSYQHCIVLSSQPQKSSYPNKNPLPEMITDVPVPVIEGKPEGEAIIEVNHSPKFATQLSPPFLAMFLLILGPRLTPSTSTATTHPVSAI